MALDVFGDFAFVGGGDDTADPFQDRQQTINWYVELTPSQSAKEVVALLGTPGLVELWPSTGGNTSSSSGYWTADSDVTADSSLTADGGEPSVSNAWPLPSTITNLPVRGFWVLPGESQAIVVVANQCYLATVVTVGSRSIPGTITLSKIGSLKTLSGSVSIRDNGLAGTAVIVDGPNGYFYAYNNVSSLGVNGTFQQITDPNFLGASTVAEIDGWWIFGVANSQLFYTQQQAYGLTFNASYVAYKDASSDQLMGVIESKEELWLIGEKTTEIWYDAGGQYFAFQRLVGTLIQVGCKATASIARFATDGQDGMIWLGRSDRGENIVVRTTGFTYEVVTTPAVSNSIANYSTISDAIGYVYQEDGHEFYVLTFPTADRTWVYDATLPPQYAWHQRLSYDPYAQEFHRHRSNCYLNFGGMRVVGDYQNGALYQMTRNAYTDAGWPILARRRSPHIWNKENRQRVFMYSLQVDFSRGADTPSSGLGSSPVARLRISRDGGYSYGQQLVATMGRIGASLTRTIWRRLGFARDAVFEIEVIDPVNRDIVGSTLNVQGP